MNHSQREELHWLYLQLCDGFSKIMFLQNIFLPVMPCLQKQLKKKQNTKLSWQEEEVSQLEPIFSKHG